MFGSRKVQLVLTIRVWAFFPLQYIHLRMLSDKFNWRRQTKKYHLYLIVQTVLTGSSHGILQTGFNKKYNLRILCGANNKV